MKQFLSQATNKLKELKNVDIITPATTLGFLAGVIDLLLHREGMPHPRAGLELVATLGMGAIAAYRYAEQALNEIFDEGDNISANQNF